MLGKHLKSLRKPAAVTMSPL